MDVKLLKETIIDYLTSKDMWEKVDDLLIDELLFNVKMANQAKDDMTDDSGRLELVSDITRDPDKEPFYQKNRLVDIYNMALKNITGLYVKLGISPQERVKLKIALREAEDSFGDYFDIKR